MRKYILVATLAGAFALPAFAGGHGDVVKQYELKDGSTVFIYKDGKMAMEDKYGRPAVMTEGTKMETQDGATIMMKGNEIWRREKVQGG